jgi:hypothetical protein
LPRRARQKEPFDLDLGVADQRVQAGGTSLWKESTEKLAIPSCLATFRVAATVGAVVSKPTPRKTTLSPGFSRAILSVSKGE